MDPRTAAPSGMTLAERFGPVPHPPRVIPEFAQQISGTLFLVRALERRSRISSAGFPG